MRRYLITLAVALALPGAALAENLALVVANSDYDSQRDVPNATPLRAAIAALGAAGFEVVELRDASAGSAAARIDAARDRIGAADRLVIWLGGHFVHAGDDAWLLAPGAEQVSDLSAAQAGLPLDAFMRLAAQHPGRAAVLLADDSIALRLGPGLQTGPGAVAAPQGVTIFEGPSGGLASLLANGLLDAGQSLAQVAGGLPRGVRASGFVSDAVAFLPGAEATPASPPRPPTAEEIEAALNLTPDTRRQVQRDLALLGQDPRGIDGIFGRGTRAAIAGWQEATRREVTGFLDGDQLVALRETAARRAEELEREAAERQAAEDAADLAYWRQTGAAGDEAGLRTYLERYPDGLFAAEARRALETIEAARREEAGRAERAAWDAARVSDTVEGYRAYLRDYPQGAFRAEAEARLREIGQETDRSTLAAAQAEERTVAGSPVTRFLVEQRLRQLGLDPGRVDQEFDEDTRRALRRFQRSRDLPVTGYVTQETMVRLLAGR